MKHRIWLAAGLLVVAGLLVAGVVYGPRLYERLTGPITPLGRITRVEKIESFEAPGKPDSVRAAPGQQLWLVHFDAQSAAGAAEKQSGDELIEKAMLTDDTGKEYKVSQGTFTAEFRKGEMVVTVFDLVFSLPQDRQPRTIRFGDLPQVKLP